MSRESYAAGFAKAAQAMGCDPVGLAKVAGTPLEEALLAIPGNALMGPLASPVNMATYLGGLMSPEGKVSSTAMNLVPGVANFNWGKRIKSHVKREQRDIARDRRHEGSRPVAHAVSEHLGPYTSSAGLVALGTLLGAASRGADRRGGAITGGLAGLGVAGGMHLMGMLAAAIRRRRTRDEQIESDKGSVLAKYLVPGSAAYGYFKRIGRSQGDAEEAARSRAAIEKNAFDWGSVNKWLGDAKEWYNGQDAGTRALIGAGGGALAGAGLASLLGGSNGTGALLGGIAGGVAGTIDWNKVLADGKPKEAPGGAPKEAPKEAPGGANGDLESKYPDLLVKPYRAALRRELERRSNNAKWYLKRRRRFPLS